MLKEKLIRGAKIGIIVLLVLAITIVSFLHWKSDLIVRNVLATLQSRLTDTLTYESVNMDVFAHFPCVAVQLSGLSLGNREYPLIDHGNVDVIIRLLPLFHGAIDIDQILVEDAAINIVNVKGSWSYDVLKKSEEEDAEKEGGKSWKTLVHQMQVNRSVLWYSDPETKTEFELALQASTFRGKIDPDLLDITMEIDASLDSLKMDDYILHHAVGFNMNGQYIFDFNNSGQQFIDWNIKNGSITLAGTGNTKRNENDEIIEVTGSWAGARAEEIKKWLPPKMKASWKDYDLLGESEGAFEIKGKSSKTSSPAVDIKGKLKNGGLRSSRTNEEVKNVNLDFHYQTKDGDHKNKSTLSLKATKKATPGNDLKCDILVVDFDKPVLDIDIQGNLPAMLINLMSGSTLKIESGDLDIQQFSIRQFHPSNQSFQQILDKGTVRLESKDLKCTYLNNPILWTNAKINSSASKLHLEFDELTWSKATANSLTGDLTLQGDEIQFAFESKLCGGQVESKGRLSTPSSGPVFQADWIVKEIDIKALLESFSNFDQTFITSENLSGKANIWAETTIPMDDHWSIRTKAVTSRSAIEIHDGGLKNLKTLDDFSDYVHIEALRDIRFNDLRNYLKIEGGQVYLPVMFIQSSAMNLSISGVHSFDQKITYYLKLNAGQTVANKLRKTDFRKDLITARKSGWINMYFVLEGTTSDVHYKQYRTAVLAGFEQSAQIKESLRKDLVDRFGYDVYWVEPNEWEDIPEYK
ncbi:MAG TPA: AsmA-like C-terminal region-containing protein [Saprospiraceae bacterium]|nr:AsmA-like C-terminal region-containing protein [Saprospiraceae bacterium]